MSEQGLHGGKQVFSLQDAGTIGALSLLVLPIGTQYPYTFGRQVSTFTELKERGERLPLSITNNDPQKDSR